MSFESNRKERMQRILELLGSNPQGLSLRIIARETDVLLEITQKRLLGYMKDLQWCGKVEYMPRADKWRLKK